MKAYILDGKCHIVKEKIKYCYICDNKAFLSDIMLDIEKEIANGAHWKTINHNHVLLNGRERIIAGCGGIFNGKKISELKTNVKNDKINSYSKNKEPIEVIDENGNLITVKCGEPMNHDEADSGKINPNFSKGGAFRDNCPSCVLAYELRRQGYDVKAKAFQDINGHFESEEYRCNLSLMWKDPKTGKHPQIKNVIGNPGIKLASLENRLKIGERYCLSFTWNPQFMDGKHTVIMWKNNRNKIEFYDPQTNALIGSKHGKDYLGYMVSEEPLEYFRVDNMIIDKNVAKKMVKP